jgi:hypothetical protein
MDAVADREPSAAVTLVVCDASTVLAVIANVAVLVLAGTVTDAGTVRSDGAPVESDTRVAAEGTGERVTVQVAEALELRLVGEQTSEGV